MNSRALRLLLILLMVGMRLAASVSLPDPTWIPGMYDDGDFDDVVTTVATTVVVVDSSPDISLRIQPEPVGGVAPVDPVLAERYARTLLSSRAPPVA